MGKILLGAVLCWCCALAQAEGPVSRAAAQPVVIGTFRIPLLVQSASDGVLIELVQRLSAVSGLPVQVREGPPQRVRNWFADNEIDVLMPALASAVSSAHLKSSPVLYKRIFTFSSRPLGAGPEALSGLRVGYTLGYTYPDGLLSVPGAEYDEAETDEQNLRKLMAGRIDVFLGEEFSALEALRVLLAENPRAARDIHYDLRFPLGQEAVYLAFQPDARGAVLYRAFEQALAQLRHEGRVPPPLLSR